MIATINDLKSLKLRKPIPVLIELEGDCFVASFANIYASGDTELEALEMLKDMIEITFRVYTKKEKFLSKYGHKTLSVLRVYKMIVRPSDIHIDAGRARIGFAMAAKDLGLKFDCRLASIWRVDINGNEREDFLELAKEIANAM